MPSLTTTRGLLGHFPQGADPPANDRRATTLPVRFPKSLSLRAILAAGAGDRSAWGGGERPQGPEGGGERGRRGGRKRGMEQGERGSDAKSDAETEEEEGDHALLTASPWGTQKIGE